MLILLKNLHCLQTKAVAYWEAAAGTTNWVAIRRLLKVFSKGRPWGKEHVFYKIQTLQMAVFPRVFLCPVGEEQLITNGRFVSICDHTDQMGSCTQEVAIAEAVAAVVTWMYRFECWCLCGTLHKLTKEVHLKLCVKFIHLRKWHHRSILSFNNLCSPLI